MNKILIFISLLLFFSIELSAKKSKWIPLEHISTYKASDYNLKKGLEYLELRQYESKENNKLRDKPYTVLLSFYRKPLNSFDKRTIKKFKKLKPNIEPKSNIKKSHYESFGVGCYYKYNAFVIDSDRRFWRMNTIEDIIGYLGEIDTPAELQTVLWLRDKSSGVKYRAIKGGYEVVYSSMDIMGGAKYCTEEIYILRVDKMGKFLSEKHIKSKKTKTMCVQCIMPMDCEES